MSLSIKRGISFRARKKVLSALTVIFSFAVVYFVLLSGMARAFENKSEIYIPTSTQRRLQSVKAEALTPEKRLLPNVMSERSVPLYISELPLDTAENKTNVISGLGTISVYHHGNGVTSDMPLEEYVLCALLAEMPTSYDIEALKAQAVACRTYAAYKALFCDKHNGTADICTSSAHCQSFADISALSAERVEIAKEAVEATKGSVMLYDGAPILAVFHAASVGYTRSSKEVWGGELPYLVPAKTSEDVFMNVTEGYGHGVGMSQYGAQCLAQEGYDHYAILSHYYKGVEFGRVE